jgi:spermidine/putrescine transport system permease protein|tara:strand:+ start:5062 stop:5853 length:792 start_codon:yes stop_codon:yes gene_type:complete
LVFIAPLFVVLGFSFVPARTFDLFSTPTLENYQSIVTDTYYISFGWSLFLAFLAVAILFVICYPLAFAMAKVFGRFSIFITIAVVICLLVSENIRLFGWVLVLMKGGVFLGYLEHWFAVELESWLYGGPIIVFGLVYVYLPFMLFPLTLGISMIPNELRQAASDLGANRWTILREVDLPLAMPGILIGCMLTFVLCAGAMAEAKVLGGQKILTMADEIETAFTYKQNWPLGSALSVILIFTVAGIALFTLRTIDLDRILGKAR